MFGCHRHIDGTQISDAMRPVKLPVQHVARFQIKDFGMIVIPGLIGDFLFGDGTDDVLDFARLQERQISGIDVDALFAPQLPKGLARNVGRGDVRPLLDMPELSEAGGGA